MSYIIIFPLIIIAGAIAMLIKPKPRNDKATSAFYQKTPINIAIENHNQCISTWNQISDEANAVLLKKQREIVLNQDAVANNALSQMVNEFNKYSDDISDYLRRSNNCIDSNDIAGSNYCVDKMQNIFINAKAMITSIKELNVTNVYKDVFDNKSPVKTSYDAYDNSVLFAGCTSQKELDARYRHLAKAFHPDNTGGDKTMFEILQKEYEEAKKLCITKN